MAFDSILADHQFFGDLAVGQAAGNQFEHIQFALGEFGEKRFGFGIFAAGILQDGHGHAQAESHLPLDGAVEQCSREEPKFVEVRLEHWAACWLVQ